MPIKLKFKNFNVSSLNDDFETFIDDIDSELQVNRLIKQICQQFNLNDEEIELIYRGEILKQDKKVKDYFYDLEFGILYIIEERQSMIHESFEKPSEINIQELCKKISNVLKSKKKRRLFEQYLKNRENLNTVYNNLQGIEQDAFTYNFLQSYDLVMQLSDLKTATLILNDQNLVYYAVFELINKFLNEYKSMQVDANFTSKSSYSINDMSEDEEDEEEINARRRPQATSSAASALTRDFFSAVLASINQNQQGQQSSQTQQQTAQQQQQEQSGGVNRDYFQSVMSQLLGQPGPTQNTPVSSGLSDEVLAQGLEQLHEFGFWDDEKNVRALQLTNGNVEAAINLMVEGVDF